MSLDELKTHLKGKRLLVGTDRTLKQMKLGKLAKVFVSKNCAEDVRRRIEHYCSIGNCTTEVLDVPNVELGMVCKKPFSVSIVGLLKQ
jgi:large subunit ribosomal protein L30e